jgi:hypothetical protein
MVMEIANLILLVMDGNLSEINASSQKVEINLNEWWQWIKFAVLQWLSVIDWPKTSSRNTRNAELTRAGTGMDDLYALQHPVRGRARLRGRLTRLSRCSRRLMMLMLEWYQDNLTREHHQDPTGWLSYFAATASKVTLHQQEWLYYFGLDEALD